MGRLEAILQLLQVAPRTTADLAEAVGVSDLNYIRVAICRLRSRGHRIHRIGRPGSHRGALYVLAGVAGSCARCGSRLAVDNQAATFCSPCERAVMDAEVAV